MILGALTILGLMLAAGYLMTMLEKPNAERLERKQEREDALLASLTPRQRRQYMAQQRAKDNPYGNPWGY